ncbi:hypothetical protein SAMD00023353_5800180 [Rosellinia necatrix]|uniref:Uncharacterized protein n=1 Tax=Rosellinia necatrix TaxID=77044 RepID=A0A1W2TRZ4_ROSNE|nr:hypothetical protein SAMD00023353_5800180 [Rosellinia necatrix]
MFQHLYGMRQQCFPTGYVFQTQPQPVPRYQGPGNHIQGTDHNGGMALEQTCRPRKQCQQAVDKSDAALPKGDNSQLASEQVGPQIIEVGQGTTIAGQSTEYFVGRPQLSLCYQCCKGISLQALMPAEAVPACAEFQALLAWWMEKMDLGVGRAVERRARNRVQEARDSIPDIAPTGLGQSYVE